jgi:hypothetical protein
MKIEKLTPEQEAQIAVYRDRYFALATSTERADRPRAEAAARAMAEIAGVKVNSVVWAATPQDGQREYERAWASLGASLRDSLWDSLRDSLRASLGASLRDSLWASLRDSLWASLRASLRDSLGASLRDSLWASLRDSLWASLRASLRDSLGDSGWTAFYVYAQEQLAVAYDERSANVLRLHNEIAASCFALWIAPGTVILCERPTTCEVVGGKLVNVEWE